MWKKATKKPIEIEYREVEPKEHIRTKMPSKKEIWGEVIHTREGMLFAYPDKDFIIRGVRGEIYPIGKDIFYETYDTSTSTVKDPKCPHDPDYTCEHSEKNECGEPCDFMNDSLHRKEIQEIE